jgi:hypothetical protein
MTALGLVYFESGIPGVLGSPMPAVSEGDHGHFAVGEWLCWVIGLLWSSIPREIKEAKCRRVPWARLSDIRKMRTGHKRRCGSGWCSGRRGRVVFGIVDARTAGTERGAGL